MDGEASKGAERLADLCPSELRSLLRYDPETGLVFRRKRTGSRGPIPDLTVPVGSLCTKGYLVFELYSRQYKLHRIAWALHTGAWPELLIDHISGVRDDNRWTNLREATYAQNTHNSDRVRQGKGYYFRKATGKYETRLVRKGSLLPGKVCSCEAEASKYAEHMKRQHI